MWLPRPKIKRPMNAFFLFLNASRNDLKAANPTAPVAEVWAVRLGLHTSHVLIACTLCI